MTTLTLDDRTRELTGFYERHAYLVYNIALRVTCEEAAARRAAERAFLSLASASDDDRVAGVAAQRAVEEASARPRTGGDELLGALAQLSPVERAAFALPQLADASDADVGTALGLPQERAAALLARARAALGDHADAEPSWIAPPEDVWQRVYAEFHRGAETAVLTPVDPPQAPKPRRRRGRRIAAAVAALAAVGAAALAAGGSGSGASDAGSRGNAPQPGAAQAAATPAGAAADPADTAAAPEDIGPNPDAGRGPAPAADPERRKPLSPNELDALRMRELDALKRYQRRSADTSLPEEAREDASRQVARIARIARERLRASERREAALRRALLRERRARVRERAEARAEARRARERLDEEPPAVTQSAPARSPKQEAKQTPAQQKPQEQGCLYNPEDQSYICPEG